MQIVGGQREPDSLHGADSSSVSNLLNHIVLLP